MTQRKHPLSSMHPDDLKAVCAFVKNAEGIIVFHSDIDGHKDSTGDKPITKMVMTISAHETLA